MATRPAALNRRCISSLLSWLSNPRSSAIRSRTSVAEARLSTVGGVDSFTAVSSFKITLGKYFNGSPRQSSEAVLRNDANYRSVVATRSPTNLRSVPVAENLTHLYRET